MRNIKIKIYNDISRKILDYLIENKVKYDLQAEKKDIIECVDKFPQKSKYEIEVDERFSKRIISLLNWQEKIVKTIPRKVYISKHLLKKMDENMEKSIINKIYLFKDKFEKGEDINSNLSKGVFDSSSWDYILNIWNIKHLHLSESVEFNKKQMTNNRSDYLLFFVLNNNNVYFIDVKKHPKGAGFTSFHFLEILEENNWLNIIGFDENKECLGLTPVIEKNEDIYMLTKQCINISSYKINGKYFTKAMGITSAGNKTDHTFELIRIRKKIDILLDRNEIEYTGFELNLNKCFGVIKYKKDSKDYKLVL